MRPAPAARGLVFSNSTFGAAAGMSRGSHPAWKRYSSTRSPVDRQLSNSRMCRAPALPMRWAVAAITRGGAGNRNPRRHRSGLHQPLPARLRLVHVSSSWTAHSETGGRCSSTASLRFCRPGAAGHPHRRPVVPRHPGIKDQGQDGLLPARIRRETGAHRAGFPEPQDFVAMVGDPIKPPDQNLLAHARPGAVR